MFFYAIDIYVAVRSEAIQASEWYAQDMLLSAMVFMKKEKHEMWLSGPKSTKVVDSSGIDHTNKWIEIMDGAPCHGR